MKRGMAVVAVLLVVGSMVTVPKGGAADGFPYRSFEARWKADEAATPNFWGPVANARAAQREPYAEGQDGSRTVQYFDKGRMEDAPANTASLQVTSGLLATELVTGRVQLGDTKFEARPPARIAVAGDADNTGPTYAEMATLYEFRPKPIGGIGLPLLLYRGGQFVDLPYDTSEQVILGKRNESDPVATYVGDPAMRYGAFVFQPFHEFINGLPDGLSRIGYPIRPYFMADVRIGGTVTRVVVQAFERRVLTYNPKNPAANRVEFGNIGQHYYRWRYEGGMGMSPGDRATATAAMATVDAGNATRIAQGGATATAAYFVGRTVVAELTQGAGTATARNSITTTARPTATTAAPTPMGTARVSSDFTMFANQWTHHGYRFTVRADGSAQEDYRTYLFCTEKNTEMIPCEDPPTSFAGHTMIRFTSINGQTAYGRVTASNDPRYKLVDVEFTLTQYGMATLKRTGGEPLMLCGPDYSKLAPPEVINQSPCGA